MKKTLVMGLGLMIGGSVLVLALAKKPAADPVTVQVSTQTPTRPSAQVLSDDIATERKILALKTQEREEAVKKSDEQIKVLLDAQESAKALALKKANSDKPVTDLVVETRPEAIALTAPNVSATTETPNVNVTAPQRTDQKEQQEKARQEQKAKEQQEKAQKEKQDKERQEKERQEKTQKEKEQKEKQPAAHTVQAGDSLIRLSRRYNVPVSALAEANGMSRNDALPRGKKLVIPTKEQSARLEQTAKERKQKQEQQKAVDERLRQARQIAKKQGINEHYAVQLALSSNQESAERLAKKYQQAGYQARTKKDAKGIRVVIPERSKEAALALKEKLNHDPSVESRGAWVLQIEP